MRSPGKMGAEAESPAAEAPRRRLVAQRVPAVLGLPRADPRGHGRPVALTHRAAAINLHEYCKKEQAS